MNVTIVTATTGGGHNCTTKALTERFGELGVNTKVLDMYRCCGPGAYRFMERGYLFAARRMKRGYRIVYGMLERSAELRRVAATAVRQPHAADCLLAAMSDTDVIISAHPFAAHALDLLKKRGDLTVPVLALVTDYCVQPFIEDSTSLEAISFASPLLLADAEAKGVGHALALGLPVRREFTERRTKAEARLALGISEERATVLVMGGSMGYGNICSTVEGLLGMGAQVICICGNNEALRRRIARLGGALLPLGYTEDVALCMDAADLIVTKPGGLTVTELMVKGLPAVLSASIPGQEERNSDFLVKNGGALRPAPSELVREAAALLADPGRLAEMSRSLAALAMPDACADICSLAISLAQRRRTQAE